eukprot:TRINITY_DN4259_c0_g1_i6.p1 TRINITY_DN4259_c0_g1~~TRINITY_DN4259_c0_g1_i6.p1  ORF type:complete len:220 (-),score=41.22 TRINITY_DN4259_c0_g1_i6:601-1236(-)
MIRPCSKVIVKFLTVMQKHNYIGEFEIEAVVSTQSTGVAVAVVEHVTDVVSLDIFRGNVQIQVTEVETGIGTEIVEIVGIVIGIVHGIVVIVLRNETEIETVTGIVTVTVTEPTIVIESEVIGGLTEVSGIVQGMAVVPVLVVVAVEMLIMIQEETGISVFIVVQQATLPEIVQIDEIVGEIGWMKKGGGENLIKFGNALHVLVSSEKKKL